MRSGSNCGKINDIVRNLLPDYPLLISAGAGMGVDSGLPDFRGNHGFWENYPPLRKLRINFKEMANPRWFLKQPSLAWGFYGQRWTIYQDTQPHEGFSILRKIAMNRSSFFVFTSNVDGHFQKAGFPSNQIVECHGSINHLQCTKNCGQDLWCLPSEYNFEIDHNSLLAQKPLPHCPSCNAIARPNILMFSDLGWNSIKTDQQSQRLQSWLIKNAGSPLVIIEIGAGSAVPTVRQACKDISMNWKKEVTFIRINPEESKPLFGVRQLKGSALDVLKKIDKELALK